MKLFEVTTNNGIIFLNPKYISYIKEVEGRKDGNIFIRMNDCETYFYGIECFKDFLKRLEIFEE